MELIVIGSGISGMSAAIQGAELGCHVLILSPFVSERAQSVMAAGGINAALGQNDTAESHACDTLSGGCFIENENTIAAFCEKAPDNIHWLESMGVVFSRGDDGKLNLRKFGGQSNRRTVFAGATTGKQIVTALIQKCREYEIKGNIERKTGLFFHSALINDGKCYGVLMTEASTGETVAFYSDAVIIAAGGQNKLFGKTTGTEICDGYTAGKLFSQGVTLRNLEFIQYHPTTIETSLKRMLISEAARGEGARLYYMKDGERCYFMEEKFGPNGNLMPRDIVSKCIYDCPSQVYLDIAALGEELIHDRLEEIYDICLTYIGLDITKESVPVYPAVHFFMGGIAVDDSHQTSIKNLYAVGECASKYHGANRLGGNSLLAAVHSGRVAAGSASKNNTNAEAEIPSFDEYIDSVRHDLSAMKNTASLYPAVYILKELADIMNHNLGIKRCGEELKSGIESIDYLLGIINKLHFDATVSLYENYRIYYMALLAKAVLLSADARKESRGAHIRTDYPEKDDNFRACSYVNYVNGNINISFKKDGINEN